MFLLISQVISFANAIALKGCVRQGPIGGRDFIDGKELACFEVAVACMKKLKQSSKAMPFALEHYQVKFSPGGQFDFLPKLAPNELPNPGPLSKYGYAVTISVDPIKMKLRSAMIYQ